MRSNALVLASAATASAAPPHILFIVSDDLGFDDVGFRSAGGDSAGNGAIRTPNIDSFAASGAVLDAYYVQDVCSPSRATFMTGRFAMHHTIVDWIPPASAYGLPLNETTMADTFKRAGYDCHAVGKWHLGFYKWGMTPTFRGFDSYTGFYSGGEDYSTHVSSGAYDMRRDPSPRCGPGCSAVASDLKGVYSTTAFTSAAVAVVEKHAAKTAAKAAPSNASAESGARISPDCAWGGPGRTAEKATTTALNAPILASASATTAWRTAARAIPTTTRGTDRFPATIAEKSAAGTSARKSASRPRPTAGHPTTHR